MSSLNRVLEAGFVSAFLLLIVARELLRAHDGPRAHELMRRTTLLALVLGGVFVVLVGRRLYDLAT